MKLFGKLTTTESKVVMPQEPAQSGAEIDEIEVEKGRKRGREKERECGDRQ
ncbi:hypothetical protein WUBG_13450, partial [Wuchereria bancrofti]